MEPIIVVAEKVIEQAVTEVAQEGIVEVSEKVLEQQSLTDTYLNNQVMNEICNPSIKDMGTYGKLLKTVEAAKLDPETTRTLVNEIESGRNIKGQFGEYIMEKKLSTLGEVERQVGVIREGASNGNVLDLRLESDSAVKQIELTSIDGEVTKIINYDIIKGDSAAFEVKNGSLQYLQQELANGELQKQITAGLENADHSFVVINENVGNELLRASEKAERIIEQIKDAGGKLIVGLPGTEGQLLIISEMIG